MYHYTDKDGYNAIRSQPIWLFLAEQPPGDRPFGAYFTTLPPDTPNLARRLRIPREKLNFVFDFTGRDGLRPIEGDRGRFIFYSPSDYSVEPSRQVFAGESGL
jgi:hypothetical protein